MSLDLHVNHLRNQLAKRVGKKALIGAAVGGAVGAAGAAYRKKEDAGKGAVVGALAGGAIGGGLGYRSVRKSNDYKWLELGRNQVNLEKRVKAGEISPGEAISESLTHLTSPNAPKASHKDPKGNVAPWLRK